MIIAVIKEGIMTALTRLLSGGVIFVFLCVIRMLVNKKMGFGDVKYSAVLSYALGLKGAWIMLFFACLLGILFYICRRQAFKINNTTMIPFGPFLSLGAFISFFLLILYPQFV
jgi:prepilin signal peptidase PulO-like enzyme (type II secretory pathway)